MKEGNNRISYIAVLFLMVFVIFGLSGCGSTGGMNDGETTVTPTETVGTVTLQVADARLLSDGTSITKVTAIVENSDGSRMSRSVAVSFSTTAGTLSATSAKTVNGVASVTLTSSTSIETATIKAASEGVSAESQTVEFTAIPMSFSLLASQNSVKSDNSDSATITATVQDVNHVAIKGVTVTFSVNGGQISASSAETDESGKAQITFSAGGLDKTNKTVSITATVIGLDSKTIPIQISGTEVGLVTDTSSIDLESGEVATLTVTVTDAGDSPIFETLVTATVISGVPGNPDIEQGNARLRLASDSTLMDTDGVLTGKTNVNGKLVLEVVGSKAGQVTIQVEALGDTKTQTFTLASAADTFAIIDPTSNPVAVSIGEELIVTVKSPSGKPVQFSTTFGTWNGGTSQVLEVLVGDNGTASAIFTASKAGAANVQVFDLGDSTHNTSDSIQIYIAAPPDTASQISLQASPTVVNPSTGDVVNTSVITATVKNANDQVVGNAVVAFSLDNTTGGGEYVSPVVVYTDKLGVAKTTFQSGSLTSSAEGVTVKAVVLSGSGNVTDSVNIKIGGVSTSVVISLGTTISSTTDNTAYIQPMSVLVADANGNPVSGAKVSLGAWPLKYATGYWTSLEPCEAVHTGEFPNEDVNRNLVLDTDEDLNGNGEVTPPNSAAGTVAGSDTSTSTSIVTTGSDGLAAFNLVYLKNSAVWIQDEISATTTVSGSETRSTYTFWLPFVEDESCNLPHSPYGSGNSSGRVVLSADKTQVLANGKSEIELTAILTDAAGNLAALGTTVLFEVISGGGGFPADTTSTAVGTSGDASATYIAPTGISSGSTVQIRASSSGYGTSNIVTIRLGEGGMTLTASPTTLLAIDSSSELSTITATILDMNDNPVEGEVINFKVMENAKGELAAASDGIGKSSEISLVSSIFGAVSLYFFPYNTSSTTTVEITATAPNMAVSKSVSITLLSEQVGAIVLDPDETDIPVGGFSTSIKATLNSTTGNPMPFGTPVTFSTTKGTLSATSLQVNNSTGTVTVTLKSDATPGAAIVTCSSGNVSQSTSVNFTSEGTTETVASMELVAADASIPATSGSSTNITATVKDSKGAAVAGAEITFSVSSNAKLFPSTSTVVADSTGVATVQLIAQGTAGDAEVTATAGTVSKRVVVKLTTSVGSIVLTKADSEISAKAGSSTMITATVKDIAGKAVPAGTEVTFATTLGKISPQTSVTTTDATGIVTVSLVAEGTAGLANITATSGGISNNTSVTFTDNPSGSPIGEAFELIPGTLEDRELALTAYLRDISDNPVVDGTLVSFKTYNTGGTVNPGSAQTEGGQVETTLTLPATIPENGISVTAETTGDITTHVTSIAVVPENEFSQIIYAGTNGGGIYKSLDGGVTWNNVTRSATVAAQNWIHPYINDLAFNPDNRNIIYAATGYSDGGQLFRSQDGGSTWNNNGSDGLNGVFVSASPLLSILCDGSGVWVGSEQNGIFYSADGESNFIAGTGLTKRRINDIVIVSNSNVLYAGTDSGVYRSTDGQAWTKTSSFTGEYINTLEIHPGSNGSNGDTIYAGTSGAGVWVSTDSGSSWVQYMGGLTSGKDIKDLLIDADNNLLYAVTYLNDGTQSHATGNVFVHELESNGTMSIGEWQTASSGLPGDSTLFAQHVMAAIPDQLGDPTIPRGFFIGGEGINMYKATTGLETGSPVWQASKSGLTNTIMSRIIIVPADVTE